MKFQQICKCMKHNSGLAPYYGIYIANAQETLQSCIKPVIFVFLLLNNVNARDIYLHDVPGGRFKNTYELLNLRALKFSPVNKIHIFQCMDKIFCVEFQKVPLKFHTKYLTHTLKETIFIQS